MKNGVTDLKPWEKGGPSPNPAGKPKGIPSLGGDLKEGIFRVFYSTGGVERLIRIINTSKKGDQIFMAFLKNIVIPILPKRTEYDIEHKSVTFVFSGGQEETYGKEGEAPEDDTIDVVTE